jgi:cytochrome c55X
MRGALPLVCGLWLGAWSALASPLATERQAQLRYLLDQDCGSCHGLTRRGGLGPSLQVEALAGKPRLALVSTILDGHPGTAMPPWRSLLRPEEAEWLVDVLLGETSP